MPRGIPNKKPDPIEMVVAPDVGAFSGGSPSFASMPAAEVVDLDAIRAELAAELAKAKELTAKLEVKAEIRSEVSEALRLQQEEAKRQAFAKMAPTVADPMPPRPEGVELIPVKLDRNYRPVGYYEVVGWDKPAVFKKKFGHEKPVQIEAAEFIKDEKAPPAVAGTGFVNKLWSGTTIRLTEPEAKNVVKAGIGARGFD